jgi:hypothetical protein
MAVYIYIYIYIYAIVLFGCETTRLNLSGEHKLAVSENTVLSRIFGIRKRETRGQRKL